MMLSSNIYFTSFKLILEMLRKKDYHTHTHTHIQFSDIKH